LWLGDLEHRHEVRDTEDVDRAAPDVRDLRHAEERRETAVRPAVDGESRAVEIGLFRYPLGHRAKVAQVDPTPVLMDGGLPRPAVSGRAVDVRNHERDPAVHQRRKVRRGRPEARTRLALRSAVRVEDRGYRPTRVARAIDEARYVPVGR